MHEPIWISIQDNVLLRGCVIKNTDFVEGIVMYAGGCSLLLIFTRNLAANQRRDYFETTNRRCSPLKCFYALFVGSETKAMLNNSGPRYKRSSLEKMANWDIIWWVFLPWFLFIKSKRISSKRSVRTNERRVLLLKANQRTFIYRDPNRPTFRTSKAVNKYT